ncbi:MAG: hypothetical protein KC493_09015 [Bacteriovoracaceae bacterium]|nr:hypothetical protein [Bacteriovoracaceae bacterium]
MKKTLAVLSIAVLGLSTVANAQQRRDPRDPRNRNSCDQQIQRMRTRLQTLQQRNIIVDQERQQCVSDLQSARQNQSMIRQNLNQCEADLAAARNRPGNRGIIRQLRADLNQCQLDLENSRNRPGNGQAMRRLRRENERLSSDNVALQSENQELRDRIFRLERQLDDLRNPPAPMNEYTAECHIDDDPGMTFDQFVMGTLTGSLQRIQQDCKDMAVSQYGVNSSQGFKKLKYIGDTFGKTSAVCHIDDDPGMTYDQFVVGTLYGNSVQEVISQCESMARFTFGNSSSSGIKNVRNN